MMVRLGNEGYQREPPVGLKLHPHQEDSRHPLVALPAGRFYHSLLYLRLLMFFFFFVLKEKGASEYLLHSTAAGFPALMPACLLAHPPPDLHLTCQYSNKYGNFLQDCCSPTV